MRRIRLCELAMATGLSAFPAAPAHAQPRMDIHAATASAEPDALALGTGGMLGMPPQSWLEDRGRLATRNLSCATLSPVSHATGAAVIVAPGGALVTLGMDNKGWSVARWLSDHGIAAFILQYRLQPTPADFDAYKTLVGVKIAASIAGHQDLRTPPQSLADAQAAFRLVRGHSKAWGVDPSRVGILGFLAGALLAQSLTLAAKPRDMPAFAGSIYGPMLAARVPPPAPPLFAAVVAGDPLFGHRGFGLLESWHRAAKPAEMLTFQSGGHGFGMGSPGTAAAGWMNEFLAWLDSNKFLQRRCTSQL